VNGQLTLPLDFDIIEINTNERKDMSITKYIGSFMVDSGQGMIGDPCYLDEWQNKYEDFNDYPNHQGEYGYLGACEATLSNNAGVLGNGMGVVFTTGYGDGVYPVFAEFNDEGRIAKVTIELISNEEDEDEE